MDNVELRAESRTILGKKVNRLRTEGWIPAVLYGAEVSPVPVQLEERALWRVLQQVGSTSLINLLVGDASEPSVVLAREIQRDILTGRVQHVDFYQVQLDRKIKTMPALEVVGESPLVNSGQGVLVQILNQIEVECLPADLIDSIPVDISSLVTLDDSISIADLPVPPGVTILADPGDTVVSVVPPRAALAEEVEALEAEEELVEFVAEAVEAEEEAEEA